MAHRPLPRISEPVVRRVPSFVVVAVCLLGIAWSTSASAQQSLKIRLLNADAESWDQRASAIGSDVLTPPGETKPVGSPSVTAGSKETSSAEPFSLSVLNKNLQAEDDIVVEKPGYLQGNQSGILNRDEPESFSLLGEEETPYQEPSLESYNEQQEFQRRLMGIREHLLNGQQDLSLGEEDALSVAEREDASSNEISVAPRSGPELMWRFAPFQRLRFFGSSFLGPSRSHEAFDKLFPWNRTPGRNQGVGEPLINDSWRWAPFGVGWFMGIMDGTPLVTDWTGAGTGYFGGYHFNWDFDHYWGFEFRYGVASLPQWDSARAFAAQSDAGIAWNSQFGRRHATLKYGDFSFLYYPWGDARWRPYARMGLGWGYVKFTDLLYDKWSNSTMTMPFGIGLKYRYSRRLVFRTEMVDNFLFGERGINPQHNLSLTAGVEVRFGGTRKAYWPYNPGRHYW